MAITLSYSCAEADCNFSTSLLDAAQSHANETEHDIRVSGRLTSNVPFRIDSEAIERAAEKRARDAAIMREARDRGLLPKDGVRK